VLLTHPDIADAAVIGVDSAKQATELPRAYIVPAKPLKTEAEKAKFAAKVAKWTMSKVAKHKFLRGGGWTFCCTDRFRMLTSLFRCHRNRRHSQEVSSCLD